MRAAFSPWSDSKSLLAHAGHLTHAGHRNLKRRQGAERAALDCLCRHLLSREAEVLLLLLARPDGDGLRQPLRILLVPRDDGVGSGRHALDLEVAVLVRDREERVREDADVRAHPRVLVAL